ncbi:MAG TPA: YvcK family protein [Mesotoga infera]|nr:YvcK family protein [Mesotoga sp.]NLI07189.1 YvcK family protein [Thermotogaceae bacterium]HNS66453.1 YvcK family protein [Mesotoga infera]HOI33747.1 YvcK family protein [Mesotoga infera]HON27815.1 YvcK family protein [Mesotoga infera]
MRKIVLIGGGTGLSTFARVLKSFPVDLTLVVAITDDGGSSGILREEMKIPPPGDIRNNIIALANNEEILTKVFSHRFSTDAMKKHSLGNIIIAGLTEMHGSFPDAVIAASKLLNIKGKVLPVADALVRLIGELDDGSKIEGESEVARYGKKIKRLTLDRKVQALPEVLREIEMADTLIVGPGSLFTSVVPNFLVSGVSEAFSRSPGKKVYICNIMTQPKESEGFDLKKHVDTVESYIGTPFDRVFWTEVGGVEKTVLERYRRAGAVPVRNDLPNDTRVTVIRGATTELIIDGREKLVVRHSRESIVSILRELEIFEEILL